MTPALKPSRSIGFFLLSMPVAAAIIHILATLMAMNDRRNTPFHRLAPGLEVNRMMVLPPVGRGHQPVAFMSADARYAICRFDAAKGPVKVTAALPDFGWTIGVYRTDGGTAYFATAAPGKRNDVNFTIVASSNQFLGLPDAPRKEPVLSEQRLTVSARDGLIVVRAPEKGLAYRAEADGDLARATCSQVPY